ncbi:MAG: glycoside hydrolase family 65 protein [Anaerolineales bacterium]|nr:glycoside hydrolase family 65 protein [Anaerolineales bacterium]
MNESLWTISETSLDPQGQHHAETIFTIGNGYLCTRGALEEGYAGDRRATFIHGVFDAAPIVVTELANAPDWLPLSVHAAVAGAGGALGPYERFSQDRGQIAGYRRTLDLRQGVLTRRLEWTAPTGGRLALTFERFAALDQPHMLLLRCRVVPDLLGRLQFRASLNGYAHNDGLLHWRYVAQGLDPASGAASLHTRTRHSGIDLVTAMRLVTAASAEHSRAYWDTENAPTLVVEVEAVPGQEVVIEKYVAVYTSRDAPAGQLCAAALGAVSAVPGWDAAVAGNRAAWETEWERTDVEVEGDDEAQIALRFNLFQMLIAAPRRDDRVNIGAKTLSGFGYRGHSFWDTEIFMLPLFTYTAPHIARNLLNYRHRHLAGARAKAQANGFEGAQFPWESADTGEEVTPTWVPHSADRARLVRIWTGDIEIHISADIAYAAHQYWAVTGDDAWMAAKGAELILDTARFWATRAEWNAAAGRYEYRDVIGPDEYHDHVDNNLYTNRLAQWNLQTALGVLDWLRGYAPERAAELSSQLDLGPERLAHWRHVIDKIYLPAAPDGLLEQFEGYFQRTDVDLASLEPRTKSAQELFGIEGVADTQIIKQPDVLMLLYLLRDQFAAAVVRRNYEYYTPRTDHTYGSSLGPAIQAIMACAVGRPDEAYGHFIRAARADLRDVRGNAGDGIHGASAGGTWQAAVFGFGGLRVTPKGWHTEPCLPQHWRRLRFRFCHRGQPVVIDLEHALTP